MGSWLGCSYLTVMREVCFVGATHSECPWIPQPAAGYNAAPSDGQTFPILVIPNNRQKNRSSLLKELLKKL